MRVGEGNEGERERREEGSIGGRKQRNDVLLLLFQQAG